MLLGLSRRQQTKLLEAAGKGDLETLERLLDNGLGVNIQDKHGMTPLIHAAAAGNYGVVRFLLKRGANANAKSLNGSTALMLAALNGHTITIRALLRHCEINMKDKESRTALMYAASQEKVSAIELLLANGAQVIKDSLKEFQVPK